MKDKLRPKTKKDWKALAVRRGELLAEAQRAIKPPLTFDTLTICFSKREVTIGGRTVSLGDDGPDCLSFPITNDQYLLARVGWVPMVTRWNG